MKFHCIQCQFDFEAFPRTTMNKKEQPRKNGTEPVFCPKCRNFIPVNPNRNRPSFGKGNLK